MTLLPSTKYLKTLKTPLCFFQTRKGTLLHLTPENQSFFEIEALLLSLGDFVNLKPVLSKFHEENFTIHKFLGFTNKICVLSPIDSIKKCIEGINKKNAVKISTTKGYEEFSIDNFLEIVNLIKPDVLIGLTEIPVQDGSGVKSHTRCVEKTLKFLDETIDGLKKTGQLDQIFLIGSIQGGKYEDLRAKSVRETIKREEVQGIMLYGLCEGETLNEREDILKKVISLIPKEKFEKTLLMLHSKGEPVDILHGLSMGVDCFEVDYPFYLAENGSAFIYEPVNFLEEKWLEKKNNDIEIKNQKTDNFNGKRAKIIDLIENKFEMEKEPIEKNCLCYSCKNHTKAYIHHLLKCKEMTANILLTIHNLHSFQLFFKNAKDSLTLKVFPEFLNWFLGTQTDK